jgi:hypothetical protein
MEKNISLAVEEDCPENSNTESVNNKFVRKNRLESRSPLVNSPKKVLTVCDSSYIKVKNYDDYCTSMRRDPYSKYITGQDRAKEVTGKKYKDYVFKSVENNYSDVVQSIKDNEKGSQILEDKEKGSYFFWEKRRFNFVSIGYKQNYAYEPFFLKIKNHNKKIHFHPTVNVDSVISVPKAYLGMAKKVSSFDMTKKVHAYEKYKNDVLTSELLDHITVRRYKMNFRSLKVFKKKDHSHRIFYRAGVIPYYNHGGKIYYGLSLDSSHVICPREDSHYGKIDLSDFGGGVDPGESSVQTALREWFEESYGFFPFYRIPENAIVSYYLGVAVFFVNVTHDFDHKKKTKINKKNNNSEEISMYEFGKHDVNSYPWRLHFDIKDKFEEELSKYRNCEINNVPESAGMLWITKEEILKSMKQDYKIDNKNIYWVLFPNLSIIEEIEDILKNPPQLYSPNKFERDKPYISGKRGF